MLHPRDANRPAEVDEHTNIAQDNDFTVAAKHRQSAIKLQQEQIQESSSIRSGDAKRSQRKRPREEHLQSIAWEYEDGWNSEFGPWQFSGEHRGSCSLENKSPRRQEKANDVPTEIQRHPACLKTGDTRFSEKEKKDRVYFCDLCSQKCVYNRRAKEYAGSYVVFKGWNEYKRKDLGFKDMLAALENGMDFTWLCKSCQTQQGSDTAYKEFTNHTLAYRRKRGSAWRR